VNRTSLSFRAAWRTRSSSLDTLTPALRPGRVSLAAFPSAGRLSSTTPATADAALFGGFSGTTRPSDFPRSCIKDFPPQRSPHGPPPADMPPREPQWAGHHRPARATMGPLGSRTWRLHACTGSQTARGPPATRDNATDDVAFRLG